MSVPFDNPIVAPTAHAQVTTTTESYIYFLMSQYIGEIADVWHMSHAAQVNANDTSNYTKYDAIRGSTVTHTANTGVANSNDFSAATGAGKQLARVSLAAAQFAAATKLLTKVGKVGTGQTSVACNINVAFVQSAQGTE